MDEGDRLIELTYIHNRLKNIFENPHKDQSILALLLAMEIQKMVNGTWALPKNTVLRVAAQEDKAMH